MTYLNFSYTYFLGLKIFLKFPNKPLDVSAHNKRTIQLQIKKTPKEIIYFHFDIYYLLIIDLQLFTFYFIVIF